MLANLPLKLQKGLYEGCEYGRFGPFFYLFFCYLLRSIFGSQLSQQAWNIISMAYGESTSNDLSKKVYNVWGFT